MIYFRFQDFDTYSPVPAELFRFLLRLKRLGSHGKRCAQTTASATERHIAGTRDGLHGYLTAALLPFSQMVEDRHKLYRTPGGPDRLLRLAEAAIGVVIALIAITLLRL
jgi:hypothetical protein